MLYVLFEKNFVFIKFVSLIKYTMNFLLLKMKKTLITDI